MRNIWFYLLWLTGTRHQCSELEKGGFSAAWTRRKATVCWPLLSQGERWGELPGERETQGIQQPEQNEGKPTSYQRHFVEKSSLSKGGDFLFGGEQFGERFWENERCLWRTLWLTTSARWPNAPWKSPKTSLHYTELLGRVQWTPSDKILEKSCWTHERTRPRPVGSWWLSFLPVFFMLLQNIIKSLSTKYVDEPVLDVVINEDRVTEWGTQSSTGVDQVP